MTLFSRLVIGTLSIYGKYVLNERFSYYLLTGSSRYLRRIYFGHELLAGNLFLIGTILENKCNKLKTYILRKSLKTIVTISSRTLHLCIDDFHRLPYFWRLAQLNFNCMRLPSVVDLSVIADETLHKHNRITLLSHLSADSVIEITLFCYFKELCFYICTSICAKTDQLCLFC